MQMPSFKIPTQKISSPLNSGTVSSKLPTLSMTKSPSIKIGQPKIPMGNSGTMTNKFNFGNFSKPPKIPKAAAMKVVKGAVKKATKNVGF